MNSTLVFSSLNYFPLGIHNLVDGVWSAGLQGKLQTIPAGFVHSTILYRSGDGLNAALIGWGDILLRVYGKERPSPSTRVSLVVDYLGYSTVAFYFYNPLRGDPNYGDYQDTILKVFQANEDGPALPYAYYLVDSFWYGEHIYDNAISLWEDSEDLLAQVGRGTSIHFVLTVE